LPFNFCDFVRSNMVKGGEKMKGKPTRKYYTEEELKKHKKGKEYIARKLAEQESLETHEQLSADKVQGDLGYYAKKEWKRIIPLLKEPPIAELYRESIETYCMLHEARKRCLKVDSEMRYSEFLSTMKEMRMIANQLGMTMSSRLEFATPDEEKEEDEIMRLIKDG